MAHVSANTIWHNERNVPGSQVWDPLARHQYHRQEVAQPRSQEATKDCFLLDHQNPARVSAHRPTLYDTHVPRYQVASRGVTVDVLPSGSILNGKPPRHQALAAGRDAQQGARHVQPANRVLNGNRYVRQRPKDLGGLEAVVQLTLGGAGPRLAVRGSNPEYGTRGHNDRRSRGDAPPEI